MQYVFPEPTEHAFNVSGHRGRRFSTESSRTEHLIVECDEKLTVSLIQHESEFNYYVVAGAGYFVLEGGKQPVKRGDLIVVPPGTKYSFGGQLKMLLINTPHYSPDQEEIINE